MYFELLYLFTEDEANLHKLIIKISYCNNLNTNQ